MLMQAGSGPLATAVWGGWRSGRFASLFVQRRFLLPGEESRRLPRIHAATALVDFGQAGGTGQVRWQNWTASLAIGHLGCQFTDNVAVRRPVTPVSRLVVLASALWTAGNGKGAYDKQNRVS